MTIGTWKSFEDLEEHLTLQELDELLQAMYNKESRRNQFAASLKGIELKAPEQENLYEKVKERAHKRLMKERAETTGKDELSFTLGALGFGVDEYDT